jgi:hypothetical protein
MLAGFGPKLLSWVSVPAGIVVAGGPPVVVEVLVVEGPVTGVVTEVEEVVWGRVLVVETSKHWEYPMVSFQNK